MAFIVGGSWFEETSEKLSFRDDVDLLLPSEFIGKIENQTIHLTVPLEDLKITLDEKLLDESAQREYLNSIQTKNQIEII